MEAKVIVIEVVLKSHVTEDLHLLADSIANNIIYNDTYDSDGIKLIEAESNIEEVSWKLK